jgi:acetyl esterase/lipase
MIPKPLINTLLTLGFVVVLPEYRLCPQVGLYNGPISDAKDALVWVRESLPLLLMREAGVEVDPRKVVAIGQSAGGNLALHLGATADPPSAILDMYGVKYFSDPFWFAPLAAFARTPTIDQGFRRQVYDGQQAVTAPSMFINGKPDFSSPRSAWMINALRDGTHLAECVKDGNYERVDPVNFFNASFPPTCIIHGTKDDFVPFELASRAAKALHAVGTEKKFIIVPDQPHVFDLQLKEDDSLFKQYVLPGLQFLAAHV